MSSQVMAEAAAAGCSEAAAELATEEAAALLAALLEQPDSAPAAAAPRALRADARMKFLREILFIVRNPFCFFLLFLPKRFCLAQFDAFLTILL
jgi:DNA-binding FadR family transcriptional regulator